MQKVFLLFGSKGIISAQNGYIRENSEIQELHGNVTMRNSRSRARSICQTDNLNLVVSDVDLGILLPSVFPFRPRAVY